MVRVALPALALLGRALLAGALLAPHAPASDGTLSFKIGNPVGSDGRTEIGDFRGQPVLFAWFKDGAQAMDAATRAAKLHKKYGKKGLVVILIDTDASGADGWAKSHAFLLSRFGAMRAWTSTGVGVPGANKSYAEGAGVALIGTCGTMVLKGANRVLGGKIEKAIKAELKKMKSGFGEDPLARKIRALAFGKGDLSAAVALAASAEKNEATEQAFRDVESRYVGLRKTVIHAAENGCFAEARDRLKALVAAVKGHAEWEPAVAALAEKVAAEETPEDHAREETLQRFEKSIARGKATAGLVKRIQRFVDTCADAKQAKAARRCATLAGAIAAR